MHVQCNIILDPLQESVRRGFFTFLLYDGFRDFVPGLLQFVPSAGHGSFGLKGFSEDDVDFIDGYFNGGLFDESKGCDVEIHCGEVDGTKFDEGGVAFQYVIDGFDFDLYVRDFPLAVEKVGVELFFVEPVDECG